MELPEYIDKMLERLHSHGFEAYVVGGCVRDSMLGKSPKDYDITTSASPEEIKAAFSDHTTIEIGIAFGTVCVVSEGENVEITTYRRDGAYSDNRRPDNVDFTSSLFEDLKRRDFTVNALAFSPDTGIIDLNNGRADLENKIIRAIGDPKERFKEDALRVLRALRFSSCLGFTIEPVTSSAIHECAELLENISGERVFSELKQTLCGGNCGEVLREYHDVFAVFLPEIEKCRGFEQHTKYHDRDVFEHTVGTVTAIAPKPHLRLAMLLHDMAKPDYFILSPDGTGHFKGHASGSVIIAERLLERLKTDSWTTERVLKLVKYHDMVIENKVPLLKRYLNRFGAELLDEMIQAHIADDSAKAPEFRERIAEYNEARKTIAEIIASEQCFKLRDLKISGNDLKKLGLSGKAIGDMLDKLLEAVIDEKCENEKEALINAAEKEMEK